MQQSSKKQTFLQGAFILLVANLMVKVIGAAFKIPLQHLIGDSGMGIFGVAYQYYTALFVISTAGVPVAMSKLIAEATARGRTRESWRIVRIAAIVFVIFGALCSLALYFGAGWLCGVIRNELVFASLRTVAPSVFFVAVISVIRGYYQGRSDMIPTAISQFIEAMGKLLLGLGFAAVGLKLGLDITMTTALVILGITIGEALAALYMVIRIARTSRTAERAGACRSDGTLLRVLLLMVIPVAITNSVTSLTTLVDTTMVVARLQSTGFSLEEANVLFGLYNGKAFTMFNLPQTLITALSVSIVPAVAGAFARRDIGQASKTMGSAMRIAMLIALPAATGYLVLAEPILDLLFTGEIEIAARLLQILALAVPFVALVGLSNAILQAIGLVRVPVITMLIGGVIKVLVNYQLVGLPAVNIYGAPCGTLLCYATIVLLNLLVLRTRMKMPGVGRMLLRPLAACIGMGAGARIVFVLLRGLVGSSIAVLAAIAVAGVLYCVLLLALHAIDREDVLMMPKGEKLARLLRL